jgi:hypothetical protein
LSQGWTLDKFPDENLSQRIIIIYYLRDHQVQGSCRALMMMIFRNSLFRNRAACEVFMAGSKFNEETIREYFEWAVRTGKKRVNSIPSIVLYALKTGNNDAEIKAWLFPDDAGEMSTCPRCEGRGVVPARSLEPVATAPPCVICAGTGFGVRWNPDTDTDERVACPYCNESLARGQDVPVEVLPRPANAQNPLQLLKSISLPAWVTDPLGALRRKREREAEERAEAEAFARGKRRTLTLSTDCLLKRCRNYRRARCCLSCERRLC